ncbi:MAG: YitT family protein [Bacteroidales bacterium]|nr:YitT family protein [Bacteroidales bacterium]
MNKKSVFVFLKEYSIITLGLLMYVMAWVLFLIPNNLVGGGVSGVASIVQYATKGVVKIGTVYFGVNAILLIIGMLTLGKGFGGKTIYAVIVASIGLNVLQGVVPSEITQILAVENGKLMSTIMGAILAGVGIGMTMSQGGSTGGTDIVALVVNKYRNVSPGRMILWMDVVIILSSLLVPSYTADGGVLPWPEKITTVVYGFILVVINSTVLDLYLSGSRQSVQLFILSSKYDQIADLITSELHRGVTVLDGKGWFTKQNTEVLMVITRRTDVSLLLRMIKSVDPNAFLSVTSVTGVYGKGFDQIKEKLKVKK